MFNGCRFYPCVSSIQTHFTRNRAIASSVAMTGTSAGGIVFPLMLQNLSSRVGFGWAVRASGFVSLFCCLVAVVCCTSRHAPRKPGPFLDVACMKDPKYLMYTLSASIACLGACNKSLVFATMLNLVIRFVCASHICRTIRGANHTIICGTRLRRYFSLKCWLVFGTPYPRVLCGSSWPY
jgi:dipeptide/tripeptide permease